MNLGIKIIKTYLFILILLAAHQTLSCELGKSPTIVFQSENRLGQYWDINDSPELWEHTLSNVPLLMKFRKQISDLVDVNQKALLTHQMQFVTSGNLENSRLLRDNEVGTIRRINCIEAQLFEYQAKRSPMFESPSEFLAYFLFKDQPDGKKIRILYYTINQPGIGSLSVSHSNLRKFIAEGWRLKLSLHNHNFDMTQANYLGGVAPSSSDVQAYRGELQEFQLKFALITNGFDTSVMSSVEFSKLSIKN